MTDAIIIQAWILILIAIINYFLFCKGWAKKLNPKSKKLIDNKYFKIYAYVINIILIAIAIFELLNPELVLSFFR